VNDDAVPSSRDELSPPAAADAMFGDRLSVAVRFAELLAGAGVERGLIGPREAPRLWDRHLLNSATLVDAVPEGASVCDIGSGAGLPGLVLAIARPDLRVTLIEPLLRRTTFLHEAVDILDLDNVTVLRGRAEELSRAHAHAFDVVTSRAVAPLDRLVRGSMPFVAPQGALIAMKGSSAADEIVAARGVLRSLGCAEPEIVELGQSLSPELRTRAVRVAWASPAAVASRASRKGTRRRR